MKSIRAFLLGMREFRLSCTYRHGTWRQRYWYDKGREWAHKLTFYNYDGPV